MTWNNDMSAAPTCATCKHWGEPSPDVEFKQIITATCNAAKDQRDIIEDALDEKGISHEERWDETEAYKKAAIEALLDEPLILNSCYGSGFSTQGHFGCIRHKLKEPDNAE